MDETVLNTILADNFIDKKEFESDPSKFHSIECFHFNLPAHPSFKKFTGITELRIMEQDVVDLEWLIDCPNIISLNVFHTQLKDTKGLKYIPNVETLFLEKNKITEMPDITTLKSLKELSLSGNLLSGPLKFPVMESITSFNLANISMATLDPSIKNFTNLERLNISGNLLSDFLFIDAVKQLQNLTELNLNDPRYGPNPVTNLPNYETIIVAALPNVSIIDTFSIPDKFKVISKNRIKEIDLYYQSCIASEVTALQIASFEFFKEIESDLLSVNPGSNIQNIEDIYSIEDSYQKSQRYIEKFIRYMYQVAFETGGNISFFRVDESSDIWKMLSSNVTKKVDISSSAQFVAAWQIYNRVVENEFSHAQPVQEFLFLPITDLMDSVDIVKQWHYNAKNIEGLEPKVSLNSDFGAFIVVNKMNNEKYSPRYLLLFSTLKEAYLSSIDSLCENSLESSVKPQSTNETLIAFQQISFELKSSLTTISLINCGITSISIFKDLDNLTSLSVPNNHIHTLKDLPHLPSLTSLDVSFNKIQRFSDLIPQEHSAASTIENINIFGNPVSSPKVLCILKTIFPLIQTQYKVNSLNIIYTHLDDLNLDFKTLTVLDITNNCITSLKELTHAPQLETLYASNNNIETIDFKSSSLLYADFSLNMISEFPTPAMFPNLKTLLINYNNIKTLSEFPTLISLFIAGNRIEAIPYPTQFPNLCVLHICENPLQNSPTDLRILYQFPKLKMLNGVISTPQLHNRAKNSFNGILFPEDLPHILTPEQTILDLSEKELSDVNSLESGNLQKLILNNNLIKSINWKINALPHLTELRISNNELQSFDFLNLIPYIRILDLSANKLVDDYLKTICTYKLTKLQNLNLSNNSFRNVPVFGNFPMLESLDLSHNYILGAAPAAFEGIKALDLSYNSLQKLDNIGASTLISLDISHNRVTTVDEVYKLAKCTIITKFAFHDNPLGHRISPRIRCLLILRSLKEMDGKLVTESDLAQVKILLDQASGGQGLSVPQPQAPPGKATRVNNVNLGFGLPSLQTPQARRQQQQQQQHNPRGRFANF